jgi:hypothetical protein
MKVGAAIAAILKREGVEILARYPVNHLIEFTAADIRPIIVRQERIGLHMADAISRMTSGRKLGVFLHATRPRHGERLRRCRSSVRGLDPNPGGAGGYQRRMAHVTPNYNAVAKMRGVTRRLPYQSGKRQAVVVIHAREGNMLPVVFSPTHESPSAALSARTTADGNNLQAHKPFSKAHSSSAKVAHLGPDASHRLPRRLGQ